MDLLTFTRKYEDDFDRMFAVEELADQALIADIAKRDSYWEVREAAVKKLTDQRLLLDVVLNSTSCVSEFTEEDLRDRIVIQAARKLTDHAPIQSILYAIASNSENDEEMRKEAINMLSDTSLLLKISNADKKEYSHSYEGNYGGYDGEYYSYTVDLREIARERLGELQRG